MIASVCNCATLLFQNTFEVETAGSSVTKLLLGLARLAHNYSLTTADSKSKLLADPARLLHHKLLWSERIVL